MARVKAKPKPARSGVWLTQKMEATGLLIDLCRGLGAEIRVLPLDRIRITGDEISPMVLWPLGKLCTLFASDIVRKLHGGG